MPLYEYYCEDCHGVFELLRPTRKASDAQPCPECDADSNRLVSNFEAFTMRDGYARKLPDDGTYWHLGQKVSKPITGPTVPNEHPELWAKKHAPPTPPTVEEMERHVEGLRIQGQQVQAQIESGIGPVVDTRAEQQRQGFTKRVRATAGRARKLRRRKSNKEVTARTVTGEHGRTRPKKS